MARDYRLTAIPTDKKHTPIIVTYDKEVLEDDVIGYSIGKAQWDTDKFVPSVKIWRDVESRKGGYVLSRQCEETTLKRSLLSALFVVEIYDKIINHKDADISQYESVLDISAADSGNYYGDLSNYIEENKDYLEKYIRQLKEKLDDVCK